MMYRLFVIGLFVLSITVLADTGQDGNTNSEQRSDSLIPQFSDSTEKPDSGLEIIKQDRYGEIRAVTNINWNAYSRIQLERATVAFREDWVRDQRRRNDNIIMEKDEQRIKSEMVDLLEEVLVQELFVKGGYAMTFERGVDVMRIVPRIVKLDIFAPDRVRNYVGHVLVDSNARMTLELEIYDSISGELLATSWQYQEDPDKGYMEEANRGTNRRAARLMLLRWATWLREWLKTPRKIS